MAFLKNIWKTSNSSKHEKLSEELALQNDTKDTESEQMDVIENENDVVSFKLKYLGSTVVEKIQGNSISTEAVKNIIKVAKAGRKNFQRVNVDVSLKGISVTDLQGNDLFKVSIYRISKCATDPTHRQVFSFISTDENETMECHAFICSKRKIADTVTLAVARAFSTAYEAWRILPSSKEFQNSESEIVSKKFQKNEKEISKKDQDSDNRNRLNNSSSKLEEQSVSRLVPAEKLERNTTSRITDNSSGSSSPSGAVKEPKLIDFDEEPQPSSMSVMTFNLGRQVASGKSFNNQWVCFEDDFTAGSQKNIFKSDLILA